MAIWVVEEYDIVVFSFWQRMRRDSNLLNATVRWTVACRRLTRRQHHNLIESLILCHEVRIRRRCGGGWGGDYLSVKNQRFLPPPLQGEARVRWEPWCGAGLPEVRRWRGGFRDGRPVPYGKDGRLGGFAGGAVVDGRLCCDNPSGTASAVPPPFTQGRLGRCRASATMDIAFEDKRRRACCRAQRI